MCKMNGKKNYKIPEKHAIFNTIFKLFSCLFVVFFFFSFSSFLSEFVYCNANAPKYTYLHNLINEFPKKKARTNGKHRLSSKRRIIKRGAKSILSFDDIHQTSNTKWRNSYPSIELFTIDESIIIINLFYWFAGHVKFHIALVSDAYNRDFQTLILD